MSGYSSPFGAHGSASVTDRALLRAPAIGLEKDKVASRRATAAAQQKRWQRHMACVRAKKARKSDQLKAVTGIKRTVFTKRKLPKVRKKLAASVA